MTLNLTPDERIQRQRQQQKQWREAHPENLNNIMNIIAIGSSIGKESVVGTRPTASKSIRKRASATGCVIQFKQQKTIQYKAV